MPFEDDRGQQNRSEKEWKIPDITHKIKGAKGQFHLSQFHIRFALRLSIVLCITFSFCRATNLEHSLLVPNERVFDADAVFGRERHEDQ